MKCVNCGAEINPNSSFCTNCGTKVSSMPQPAAQTSAEAVQPPVAQPVYQAQPQATAQPYIVNNTTVEVTNKNGIGTGGFVCALIGLFLSWIPILGWILWLVGAVLSVIGIFKKPRGLAIAGTIISFIDLIILIFLIGAIAGTGAGLLSIIS